MLNISKVAKEQESTLPGGLGKPSREAKKKFQTANSSIMSSALNLNLASPPISPLKGQRQHPVITTSLLDEEVPVTYKNRLNKLGSFEVVDSSKSEGSSFSF